MKEGQWSLIYSQHYSPHVEEIAVINPGKAPAGFHT